MHLAAVRAIPPCLAALALLAAGPALAAESATPGPQALAAILGCADHEGFQALAEVFLTDAWPAYLHRQATDDEPLGYMGYRLDAPIDFHGRPVSEIGFVQDWIVTPLPRAEAEALAAELRLERAPMAAAEQHFGFFAGDEGPMFSIFGLGDALAQLFTDDAPPAPVLYAGCNYRATSRADFLAQAARADALIEQMRGEVLDMLTEPGSAPPGKE